MRKICKLILACLFFCNTGASAFEITPGTLKETLGAEAETTTSLLLTGRADVRDLIFIASMPTLREVDMGGLKIESLQSDTALMYGRCYFPANTFPSFIFALGKMEKITLPSTLTAIEECAFASATGLKQVAFGDALQSIGDWAFHSTAITSVALPASVDTIGAGAFADCISLTSAQLAATNLHAMPEKSFRGCVALKSITLPATLVSIGKECFLGSGLEILHIPTGVNSVGEYALSTMPTLKEVSLNYAEVSEGVLYNSPVLISISGMNAFPALGTAMCPMLQLDSVESSALTSIGAYALAGNSARKLWFSDQLTFVGEHALDGMANLNTIFGFYMHGNVPETEEGAFSGLDNIALKSLWVDEDYKMLWYEHPEWNKFNIIGTHAGIDGVETSGNGGLSVAYSWQGDILSLTSSEVMRTVCVFDTDGMALAVSAPGACSAEMDLSGVSANIVVVRVATAIGEKSFKTVRGSR